MTFTFDFVADDGVYDADVEDLDEDLDEDEAIDAPDMGDDDEDDI